MTGMSNLRDVLRVTTRQGRIVGDLWHSVISPPFPHPRVAMRIVLRWLISSRRVNRGSLMNTAAGGLLIMVAAFGCSDSPAGLDASGTSASPFVVSAPRSTITAGYSATDVALTASASETQFVYVALPPGSIPNADVVTIRVQSSGVVVTANAVDGGLDPVAVPAASNDTLRITVSTMGSTGSASYIMPVLRLSRPVVIRTSPPPKKRDVPLNSSVVVLFSEPIAAASLTPAAVQLRRGGTPVPAHLAFGDLSQLTAVLIPDAALVPATVYTLTITQEIKNLDGQPLSAPVSVEFTTEPQASVAITYHVGGTVIDDTGVVIPGATLMLTFVSNGAPGTLFTQAPVTADSDGKFSADVLAVPFTGTPPGVIDAIALLGTSKGGYDSDYRYVPGSNTSELRIRLYRSRQILAGDSLRMAISPDDAICTNNVQDYHPWPVEWVCRTTYVLPPADGWLTIYAGACQPTCLPIGLEAEPTDWTTLYWSLYPATGWLQMPVKRGLPVRVNLEIPLGSAGQSFMLRTSFTPTP